MEVPLFRELIRRVRDGDETAITTLVEHYGPLIRAYIQKRLHRQPQLAGLLDSEDVWQSILRRFFVRLAEGEFILDTPEDLAKLLTRMGKNYVANKAKAEATAKRDRRRAVSSGPDQLAAIPDAGLTPSETASLKEQIEKVHRLLSPFERFLAEQWAEGTSWEAIARDIGDNVYAKALSRRFERAVKKAAKAIAPNEGSP